MQDKIMSIIQKNKILSIRVLFLVGLFILLLNMIRIYWTVSFNSDDVSQQVLLQQWLDYGFAQTWLPIDTFVLKFPIHLLLDNLGFSPRHTALVAMVFMNVSAYTITFVSFKYLSRVIFKIKNDLFWVLPLLFVYSINSRYFTYSIKNINLRMIESAIMFGIVALVARWITKTKSTSNHFTITSIVVISITATLTGLFYYNDPAFIIYLGSALLSILAVFFLSYSKNRVIIFKLSYFIISSFIAFEVFEKIFATLGFKTYETYANFVDYENFWGSLSNAIHGMLGIFGADFFGKLATSFTSIIAIGAFTILGLYVYFIYRYFSNTKIVALKPMELLVFSQPLIIFISYFVSENSSDMFTTRYLYLLPFYSILVIAINLQKIKNPKYGKYILILFGFVTVLNVLSSLSTIYVARRDYTPANNFRNETQAIIINALANEKLTKGYAGFWSANINNYLSDGMLTITPVSCNEPQTRIFYWLYTEKIKEVKADRSFLIVSRNNEAAPSDYGDKVSSHFECNTTKLIKEFGTPSKILTPTPETEIFVYEYDIGSKLGARVDEAIP